MSDAFTHPTAAEMNRYLRCGDRERSAAFARAGRWIGSRLAALARGALGRGDRCVHGLPRRA